jgi:hypothetical protein
MGDSDQSMAETAAIDSRASPGLSFDTPARLSRNALNIDRGIMSNMNGAAVATAPLTDSWRHGQTFARIRSSQGQRRHEDWSRSSQRV